MKTTIITEWILRVSVFASIFGEVQMISTQINTPLIVRCVLCHIVNPVLARIHAPGMVGGLPMQEMTVCKSDIWMSWICITCYVVLIIVK